MTTAKERTKPAKNDLGSAMNSAPVAEVLPLSYVAVRKRLSNETSVSLRLLAIAGLAGLAAAGYFLAPHASPPIDLGSHSRWGGWALEAAFTYAAFHAAVISFRVTELLFRDPLSELVRTFPVPTRAVVGERLRVVMRESALFFAPALLFLAGACAASASIPIGLSLGYLVAAIVINGGIAFGTTLLIVSSSAGIGRWFALSSGPESASKAAYFASAPAVTLAVVGIIDLFLKLGWEEILAAYYRDGAFSLSRAAIVVLSVVAIVFFATLFAGMRQALSRYRRFLAAFDRSMFQPPAEEEWVASESVSRSRWTRSMSLRAGLLVDRKRTEFRRVHPFLLFGNYVAAFLFLAAGIVWRNNPALQFLPPALAALWVAGAIRIPERLMRLSTASEVLDCTLVSRRVNDATTGYAAWVIGSHCLFPLIIASTAASGLFGNMTGIAVACLVTLLVEQWAVLRVGAGTATLGGRALAVVVGIGVSMAVLSSQAADIDVRVAAIVTGSLASGGWLWLGFLLRNDCAASTPNSSTVADQL